MGDFWFTIHPMSRTVRSPHHATLLAHHHCASGCLLIQLSRTQCWHSILTNLNWDLQSYLIWTQWSTSFHLKETKKCAHQLCSLFSQRQADHSHSPSHCPGLYIPSSVFWRNFYKIILLILKNHSGFNLFSSPGFPLGICYQRASRNYEHLLQMVLTDNEKSSKHTYTSLLYLQPSSQQISQVSPGKHELFSGLNLHSETERTGRNLQHSLTFHKHIPSSSVITKQKIASQLTSEHTCQEIHHQNETDSCPVFPCSLWFPG